MFMSRCKKCKKTIPLMKFVMGLLLGTVKCNHCGAIFVLKNGPFGVVMTILEFVILPIAVIFIFMFKHQYVYIYFILLAFILFLVSGYMGYKKSKAE